METRSDLVRHALAGDTASARAFIEQNHPSVYRLALTLLDDPAEAALAAHESGAAQLDDLENYPGPEHHTAWLYELTVRACRRRLRLQQLAHYAPRALQKYLRPPVAAQQPHALPEPSALLKAVSGLDEPLRLALILRYAHDLLPHEIALVLHWRDSGVQDRLAAARARLRPREEAAIPADPLADSASDLSHEQAEALLEAAADFRITDGDDRRLKRHLRDCERCSAAAQRLQAFENELRAAFQARWWGEQSPPDAIGARALEHRRRWSGYRRWLSLAGGLGVALLIVAVVFMLPGLSPATVTAPPGSTPTRTPRPGELLSPPPDYSSRPNPPVSQRGLLANIYSGKIAYINFNDLSDHLFTFRPGVRGDQQLTVDFADDSAPAWSPDGRQIAFLSRPGGKAPNQVEVINADGSGERVVWKPDFPFDVMDPNNVGFPIFGPPRWSPDGKSILSAVWATSTEHYLVVMPLAGGEVRRLPADGLDLQYIDWSADGKTIVYLADHGLRLWSWQPDQPLAANLNPHPLNFEGVWDSVYGLSISPDSSQIALLGGLWEVDVIQVDLRILDISGKELQVIPISTGVLTRTPTHGSNLAWSPDGKFLAFTPVFTNSDLVFGRILLVQAGGKSTSRPLAEMEWDVSGFTWSPNSRWIAFSTGYEIWAASLDSYEVGREHLVRLSGMPGYSLQWQPTN